MRFSGSPCKNKEGYCWQDPVGKRHYKIRTHHLKRLVEMVKKNHLDLEPHDDVPNEIRQRLYAEEQQCLERQQKANKHPSAESPCPPINYQFPTNAVYSTIYGYTSWFSTLVTVFKFWPHRSHCVSALGIVKTK